MRYCVTVTKTGCVYVDAETEAEAMDIAEHQLKDDIWCIDDWKATEVFQDDSALAHMYKNTKAF